MARAAARDQLTDTAADAAIDQACRILRLPTIRDRHGEVAAAASRQQASYKGFLVELLSIECDDRETRRKARLVREAGFPRPKRLEDFDYAANPNVPAALISTLAGSAWVAAGQPLLPDRRQRHRQVPPADRAGHRRRRERLPGPVCHRRRAGQRARRGRRRQDPVPHHRPLRPRRPALPGRAGLPRAGPARRRAAVPGLHRARGTRLHRDRLQRRLLRVDIHLHRPAAVRRHRRPAHLRRAHHHHRHRLLPAAHRPSPPPGPPRLIPAPQEAPPWP